MKRVAVFVVNPVRSPYRHDQYDSFRTEGRFPINIGFGLSLLGFEVNLIMNEWKVDSNRQVWNNVYLSNVPKYDHYDYLLTWAVDTLYAVNFDSAIFMDFGFKYINNILQFIYATKKKITYTNPIRYMINYIQEHKIEYPIEVNYLPPLFPIPSINIGFVPYTFKFCPELKIYVYCNLKKIGEKFVSKEQLVINFFRNKGYKLKLYVHVGSKEESHCFEEDNIAYLYELETRYIDIINTMILADICIIVGSNCGSPCLIDAISLGKPVIYISDSIISKDIINCIYERSEYLLYIQESDEESIKKLERFVLDPKESYDKFKESHKDFDFNNWKEFAKQIFI